MQATIYRHSIKKDYKKGEDVQSTNTLPNTKFPSANSRSDDTDLSKLLIFEEPLLSESM